MAKRSQRVTPQRPTQVLSAAFVAAMILAPIFWVVGVLHFGAITGPAVGVLVAAPLLHLLVRVPPLGPQLSSY
jgi:hypothetical protein